MNIFVKQSRRNILSAGVALVATFGLFAGGVQAADDVASLGPQELVSKVANVSIDLPTAEEFVGHVAGFKLGEVIGETTAGAGFRNQFYPVSGGYVISVSVGRASASWMQRSATWMQVGSRNLVCGVTRPAESAPATVTSPG